MNFILKNEKVNKTTVSITLDRLNLSENENDVKALLILLGGYNVYGRRISLEQHRENMKKFKDLIESISEQI